jgi:hypothetical protein
MKGPFLKRRPIAFHKPFKVGKPLTDWNDFFEYNVNTNVATRGEGTLLIHPSYFKHQSRGRQKAYLTLFWMAQGIL